MRVATWVVLALIGLGMLVIGGFGLFTLLVGLNGVSESQGGQILLIYVVLVVLDTIAAMWAGRWALRKLSSITELPVWLNASFAVTLALFAATILLAILSFVVLVVALG